MVVYWLETGIVVAVYAAKIIRAEGTDDPDTIQARTKFAGKRPEWYVGKDNRTVADALVLEFVGPWLWAGLFIVGSGWTGVFQMASVKLVALATVGLVVYHVFSYRYEYVGLQEYERRGPVSMLVEPVPRVWVLLLTVVLGLGATASTGSPIGVVVVLTVFKTGVDLLAQDREKRRARSR